MKSTITLPPAFLIALAVMAVGLSGAFAQQNFTWTQPSGNTAWTSTTAWSPNGTPGANDNIVGNTTSSVLLVNGTHAVNNWTHSANNWTIAAGASAAKLTVGGTLTNTGANITFRDSGDNHLSATFNVIDLQGGIFFLGANAVPITGFSATSVTIGNSRMDIYLDTSNGSGTATINNLSLTHANATINIRYNNQATTTSGTSALVVNGLSGTTGTVRVTGATTTSAVGGSLLLQSTGSTSYSGLIADSAGTNAVLNIVKSGAGTQVLGGNNTYSGGTMITNGTLLLTHSNAAGTGGVSLNGGNLSVNVNSGSGAITNTITFTNEASNYVLERASGQSLSVLSASSDLGGGVDTTASILQGTAGAARTLTSSFAVAEPGLQSDVFSLSGIPDNSDVFVLQLQIASGVTLDSYLAWWDGSSWVNAVLGNTGGSGTFQGDTAYNAGLFTLGNWGVDTSSNSVWAVLNHNSEFAIVPEPRAWMLLGLGMAAIILFRRRRLA